MLQTGSHDFLNPSTIGSFGGSTAAILAVTVALRKALRINTPILPLLLGLAISVALAYSQGSLKSLLEWIVAVVNGCLLFLAVIGANEATNSAINPQPVGQGEQHGAEG